MRWGDLVLLRLDQPLFVPGSFAADALTCRFVEPCVAATTAYAMSYACSMLRVRVLGRNGPCARCCDVVLGYRSPCGWCIDTFMHACSLLRVDAIVCCVSLCALALHIALLSRLVAMDA